MPGLDGTSVALLMSIIKVLIQIVYPDYITYVQCMKGEYNQQ